MAKFPLEVPFAGEVVESLKQMDDVETIAKRNERLIILKQYTDDEKIWEHVDNVAFICAD